MAMMDTAVLNEIGLSDREIKVYVALLELGSSKAGPIAAKSGLPHTKVYETLGKLMEKGLVTYVVVSKTKFFDAADPKDILHLIDDRRRRVQALLAELQEKRRFAKEKQVAIVHEGYKAVRAIFPRIEDELKKGDTYRVFALKETYRDPAKIMFLRSFHETLSQKGIIDKVIAHTDVQANVKSLYKGNKNLQLGFVKRSMPLGVMIFGDKVIQLIWGDRPTGIEIVSTQINEQYKKFFDDIWDECKSKSRG